jgi:catechol 2,3-dioxygenase-like lactoylglutathione lyase family enzyme
MVTSVLGIHHVTAIAGDPQQNVDFYTEVLGLRLVKVTVDVHDPEVYHLFYGTGTGQPGTLLTFHCWPGAIRGRPGTGQIHSTALGVPPESLESWRERLLSNRADVDGPYRRDGVHTLSFHDPDGLLLDLVAEDSVATWEAPVGRPDPVDRAIRGLHGITVWADSSTEWKRLLAATLGLELVDEDTNFSHYAVRGGGPGSHVTVRILPGVSRGLTTVGCVDHVAFRVSGRELDDWRSHLADYAGALSPVEDHVYYRALRLEGPEDVRVELASDGPGVTVDQAPMELGTHLVLPPWLEAQRPSLNRRLQRLRLPGDGR